MESSDISSWLKDMRKKGFSDARIRGMLRDAGWVDGQINEVLRREPATPPVEPEISKKLPGWSRATRVSTGILAVGALAALAYFFIPSLGVSWPWQLARNTNHDNDLSVNVLPYTPPLGQVTLSEQLERQAAMRQFENYDQVREFLTARATSAISGYGAWERNTIEVDGLLPNPTGVETFGLGAADLKADLDYSSTNIQVQGVDEDDILKTDGKYMYIVSGKRVLVVQAYPAADAAIVATIELDSVPEGIYLHGDRLVVYGQEANLIERPFYGQVRPSSAYTFLAVYDVADPAKPTVQRELQFEGRYADSRMVGDYLYFVTTHDAYGLAGDDHPVPFVVDGGSVLSLDPEEPRCLCPDLYYIEMPQAEYAYTTVTAIKVTDREQAVEADVFLLAGTENLYVSQTAMYLAYTKHLNETQLYADVLGEVVYSQLPAAEQQRVADIREASATILSENEKVEKVLAIYATYVERQPADRQEQLQEEAEQKLQAKYRALADELETTVIHKVALADGQMTYRGSGEVTGHLLNQFSMDEYDSYFRVATTRGQRWWGWAAETDESYSNVYVLNDALEKVGAVERLAPGEQIYAARFMQGRAYLVTFRQVDPLFAVDLADPKNPRLLGELKVPGFSSYLHPYDETTLIGFGKQADTDGRVQGLKLSLFDVADVRNLREIDTYEMGEAGSDSVALTDHKAFLFSRNHNLLVVPVSLQERQDEELYRYTYTQGAMVFTVTENGFEFRKRVDHSDGALSDSAAEYYAPSAGYYGTAVKRSYYIEDTLYTLSDSYLKMNWLESLEPVNTLTLKPSVS